MPGMSSSTRLSAAERRDDVLDAALIEFADRGFEGTSTEDIAKRAGISQPYLLQLFQRAAEGLRGEESLHAIGEAYVEQLETNRVWLRAQMQGYAASEDPEIRRVVREGFGDLIAYVRRVSRADWPQIWQFFATGMLLNVLSSMQVTDNPEPWMTELLEGCGKDL